MDTTNENPVDETLEKNDPSDDSSEKQEEKNTDVEEKKAEDSTDAAMAIESEAKDMEKDKDAEETDIPEQDKTGKEETGDDTNPCFMHHFFIILGFVCRKISIYFKSNKTNQFIV